MKRKKPDEFDEAAHDVRCNNRDIAAALRRADEEATEREREAILTEMEGPRAPYHTWEMAEIIRARRKTVYKCTRAMAGRAVLAMLQDPAIGFEMINDLEERIAHAVTIAAETENDDEAIERAAENMMPETQKKGGV